ncbi:hypothetical protein BLOT_014533, partial [Blomia tropicalis]
KTINLKTYKKTYQNHIHLKLFIIDFQLNQIVNRHFATDKSNHAKENDILVQLPIEWPNPIDSNPTPSSIQLITCVCLLQFIPTIQIFQQPLQQLNKRTRITFGHFAIDKLPIELPIQSIQIQDAKFHPNVSTILASNECIRIN